jgi:hypothetical protein
MNFVSYSILIVCSALLGCQPIDRKRRFAGWATALLVLVGVLGISQGMILIAWDLDWISVGEEGGHRLWGWLSFMGGISLGMILALLLSREMFGHKKTIEPNLK